MEIHGLDSNSFKVQCANDINSVSRNSYISHDRWSYGEKVGNCELIKSQNSRIVFNDRFYSEIVSEPNKYFDISMAASIRNSKIKTISEEKRTASVNYDLYKVKQYASEVASLINAKN